MSFPVPVRSAYNMNVDMLSIPDRQYFVRSDGRIRKLSFHRWFALNYKTDYSRPFKSFHLIRDTQNDQLVERYFHYRTAHGVHVLKMVPFFISEWVHLLEHGREGWRICRSIVENRQRGLIMMALQGIVSTSTVTKMFQTWATTAGKPSFVKVIQLEYYPVRDNPFRAFEK